MPLSLPSGRLCLWLTLSSILTTAALATTLDVPGEYPTIQAAVDAAVSGDSIRVDPGDYGDVLVVGKVLTIAGQSASNTLAGFIEWRGPGTNGGILDGFTIRGSLRIGEQDAGMTVTNCSVLGETIIFFGDDDGPLGGVLVVGCHFEGDLNQSSSSFTHGFSIEQCTFEGASAFVDVESGGGNVSQCRFNGGSIGVNGEFFSIWENDVIDGDIALGLDVGGGGISANRVTNGSIFGGAHRTSVSVGRNLVTQGGIQVDTDDASADVDDNTVIGGNTGLSVYAFTAGDTFVISNNLIVSCSVGVEVVGQPASVQVACNDVWKNVTNWAGIADPTGIDGNISLDPLFCDRENGVFTLRPGSPCLPGASSCGQIGALGQGCTGPDLMKPPHGARTGLVRSLGPNPTRGPVLFKLGASASKPITLDLFDVRGRRVRRLEFGSAVTELAWDGRSSDGQAALPGVYFYTLRTKGEESSGRLEVLP